MHNNIPANTGHSPKAVSMLAHRLRRWPNIETALGACLVFAGIIISEIISNIQNICVWERNTILYFINVLCIYIVQYNYSSVNVDQELNRCSLLVDVQCFKNNLNNDFGANGCFIYK